MKKLLLSLIILVEFGLSSVIAQNPCPNSDFSMGNFTNWIGSTGSRNSSGTYISIVPGIVAGTPNSLPSTAGQQTIMNLAGNDPNTGNALSVIPPSGTSSCRLGNAQDSTCVSGKHKVSRLEYKIKVTPSNCIFTYQYAVVLQNPTHPAAEQPKFTIYMLDSTGSQVGGSCGYYTVAAESGLPGFSACSPASNVCSPSTQVVWKNWTTVSVDLSSYIGKTITAQFTTYDCFLGDHFGYAYISCSGTSLNITQQCSGTSDILSAPAGYATYSWTPTGGSGANTQNYTVANPVNGTIYTCICTSVMGCTFTYKDTLKSNPVNFSINSPTICAGGTATLSATGSGFTYNWSNGLGTNQTVTVSPTTTTTYTVTAASGTCSNTAQTIVTVNSGPSVSISSSLNPVCGIWSPSSATLTATGASTYSWSGGLGASNQITVTPGSTTTYTVTGSDAGCSGTASFTEIVDQFPSVSISASENPVCSGTSTTLTASGATTYSWDNGLGTSNPVTVNPTTTTTYTVLGSNVCTAAFGNITVNVNKNPFTDFTLVPSSTPHLYYVTDSITGVPPLKYIWSWGDGSANDTIAYPSHTYSTAGNYNICLTITDSTGCTSTYCDSSYLQKTTNSMIYVEVVQDITTGINENELSNQIKFFPNPVFDNFQIQTSLPIKNIEITDITGRMVCTTTNKTIDCRGYAKGVYFVKVQTEKGLKVKKIVKE